MDAGALAGTILSFAAIVALGAILRATGLLRREDSKALNAVIIYVGLPAFIFGAVYSAELSADTVGVVVVAWAVTVAVGVLAWLLTRLLRLEGPLAAAFIIAAMLGNTGYIGYPLTEALLGKDALAPAVFYDVFGTVFALVLIGMPVAARLGRPLDPAENGESVSPARVNVVRELVTFPAVIALVAGLALHPFAVPEPVMDWLDVLGNMVAPLIMLSVGISLRPRSVAREWRALSAAVALRLLVAPAIAMAVAALVLGDPDLKRVAVLEASVPTMMITLAVGERFGADTDFIASAIFVTTLLSAATIPLAQALVG